MSPEFERMYNQHLTAVWHYVRARVPDHHEAQDVTSEVFARAWRSWPRFDAARGTVAAWLFRIAHHTVADWYRRQARVSRSGGRPAAGLPRRGEASAMSGGLQPEQALLEEELLAELQRHLRELSDREREALALRFGSGLTAAEIGDVLGMSEGAVKMMVYRATMKLKAVMVHDSQG